MREKHQDGSNMCVWFDLHKILFLWQLSRRFPWGDGLWRGRSRKLQREEHTQAGLSPGRWAPRPWPIGWCERERGNPSPRLTTTRAPTDAERHISLRRRDGRGVSCWLAALAVTLSLSGPAASARPSSPASCRARARAPVFGLPIPAPIRPERPHHFLSFNSVTLLLIPIKHSNRRTRPSFFLSLSLHWTNTRARAHLSLSFSSSRKKFRDSNIFRRWFWKIYKNAKKFTLI